jgi:hypothetical protein
MEMNFVIGFAIGFFALMFVDRVIRRLWKSMGKNSPVQPTSEE